MRVFKKLKKGAKKVVKLANHPEKLKEIVKNPVDTVRTILGNRHIKDFNKGMHRLIKKILEFDKNCNGSGASGEIRRCNEKITIIVNGKRILKAEDGVSFAKAVHKDGSLKNELTDKQLKHKSPREQLIYLLTRFEIVKKYLEILREQLVEKDTSDKDYKKMAKELVKLEKECRRLEKKIGTIGKEVGRLEDIWENNTTEIRNDVEDKGEDVDDDDSKEEGEYADDDDSEDKGEDVDDGDSEDEVKDADDDDPDEDVEIDAEGEAAEEEYEVPPPPPPEYEAPEDSARELAKDKDKVPPPPPPEYEAPEGAARKVVDEEKFVEKPTELTLRDLNEDIADKIDSIRSLKSGLEEIKGKLNHYENNEGVKELLNELNIVIGTLRANLLGVSSMSNIPEAQSRLEFLTEIILKAENLNTRASEKMEEIKSEESKNLLNSPSSSVKDADEDDVPPPQPEDEAPEDSARELAKDKDKVPPPPPLKGEVPSPQLLEDDKDGVPPPPQPEDEAPEDAARKVVAQEVIEEAQEVMEEVKNDSNASMPNRIWRFFAGTVKAVSNLIYGSSEESRKSDEVESKVKELEKQTEQVKDIVDITGRAKELLDKLGDLRSKISEKSDSLQALWKLVTIIDPNIEELKMILKDVNSGSDIDAAERKAKRLSNAVERAERVYKEVLEQSTDLFRNLIETIVQDVTDKQKSIHDAARRLSDKMSGELFDSLLEKADAIVKNFWNEKEKLEHPTSNSDHGDQDLVEILSKYENFYDALKLIAESANDELNKISAEIKKIEEETFNFRRKTWSGGTLPSKDVASKQPLESRLGSSRHRRASLTDSALSPDDSEKYLESEDSKTDSKPRRTDESDLEGKKKSFEELSKWAEELDEKYDWLRGKKK